MKYFLAILLFAISVSFAQGPSYILGMRNSKYAYAGIKPFQSWGIAYENSVFTQDLELQYGRIALFYVFDAPFGISGSYAFFYGIRYNFDYYDFGAELELKYDVHPRYLQIKGILQPRYDSDAKGMFGYSILAQTMPLGEVGLFAGFKNLPEYRDVEQRLFAGVAFETPHLKVLPEISTPVVTNLATIRVSISFVYMNLI